ncbi:MAG TPA: response regulator [Tepidisphaeraceae bacterium]|nr:response regulator [Tepidisphaeraceae bacterium]
MKKLSVLLLEDSPLDAELTIETLRDGRFEFDVTSVDSPEGFLDAVRTGQFDLILSDYNVPHYDVPDALAQVRKLHPDLPLIFVSGTIGEEVAIDLLKAGATDYVLKHRMDRLVPAVSRALKESRERAELRDAQKRLEDSEAKYRFLAESIPTIVWTANADGYCDYVNQRWFEYTGLNAEETVLRFFEIVHPDDLGGCTMAWQRSAQEGVPFDCEYRFRRASDGAYRWHIGRCVPWKDENGRIQKWFGTATDIDDQKRAEQERDRMYASSQAARLEAENANRMKDEFLATLSHELRTPLNAILGWAAMLRTPNSTGDDLAEGLEIIERNARSQAQLIEDLLDVSRIISGKLRLEVTPTSLGAIVEQSIEALQLAAGGKQITMELVVDPGSDVVMGDAGRLQQVVWNLLSNSIKFTPRGGHVTVRVGRSESHMEIHVIDSGKGIAPEFLPYVFDRFRQADSTSRRSHGGLGLGLAIVRHLVESHGGSVRAESEGDGKGATFIVALPLLAVQNGPVSHGAHIEDDASADVPAVVVSPETNGHATATLATRLEKQAQPSLAGVRVLTVDDEPDVRSLVAVVLREAGATSRAVASVDEALAMIDTFRPDVLVSDIGMPGQDGYALVRILREREQADGHARHLPAIALTAYATLGDRRLALAAGFDVHMSKPVTPLELATAIASAVRGRDDLSD